MAEPQAITTDLTNPAPTAPVQGVPAPEAQAPAPEAAADPVHPKYAALARKEKAIRERMRAMEAKERAIAEKEQALAAKELAPDWKKKLAEKPTDFFMEAGLTGDQLTQAMLNYQATPEQLQIRALEAKLAALESGQTKAQEEAAQRQEQTLDQARKQVFRDVSKLVENDENYEMINGHGDLGRQAVVSLIEETYKDEGFLMSIADAAKEVEEHLLSQALELTKMKKIQSRMAPQAQATNTEPQKTTAPQKTPGQSQPTLSNRMTVSSARPGSDKERRERAMAAFHGQKL